jgi:DNA polymerase elongation subunit (family B)
VDPVKAKADVAFCYDNERDLLEGFATYRNRKRPNLSVGYNNYGFDLYMLDMKMMRHQLSSLWCGGTFSGELGRRCERELSQKFDAKKVEVPLYLYRHGHTELDVFPFAIKKNFPLPNFQLDSMAAHFLEEDRKIDFKPMKIFLSYKNKDVQECANYCVQDTVVLKKLSEKLKFIEDVFLMAQTFNIDLYDVYAGGEQMKSFPTLFSQAQRDEIVFTEPASNVKKSGKFKGAIVLEPKKGLHNYAVSLDFNSLYPSIMQHFNICPSTYVCLQDVHLYRVEDLNVINFDFHEGCDHDPLVISVRRIEESLQKVELKILKLKTEQKIDKSLSGENKKRWLETLKQEQVRYEEKAKKLREEMAKEKANNPDIFKTLSAESKKGTRSASGIYCSAGIPAAHFVKREVRVGFIPKCLAYFLEQRKRIRAEIEHVKMTMSPEEAKVKLFLLDKQQLGFKISANAMYGCLGAAYGGLQHAPCAGAVTQCGRNLLVKVKKMAEEDGFVVLYGDTDSVYLHHDDFANMTYFERLEKAEIFGKKCSDFFGAPLKLAVENVMHRLLLMAKKTYVYIPYNEDGTVSTKISSRGSKLSKNDGPPLIKEMYHTMIELILAGKGVEEIKERFDSFYKRMDKVHIELIPKYLKAFTSFFAMSDIHINKFMLATNVNAEYEKTLPPHAQAAKRAAEFGVQDTKSLYIVHLNVEEANGEMVRSKDESVGCRANHLDYISGKQMNVKIDAQYYMQTFCKSLENVFQAAFQTNVSLLKIPEAKTDVWSFSHLTELFKHHAALVETFLTLAEWRVDAIHKERMAALAIVRQDYEDMELCLMRGEVRLQNRLEDNVFVSRVDLREHGKLSVSAREADLKKRKEKFSPRLTLRKAWMMIGPATQKRLAVKELPVELLRRYHEVRCTTGADKFAWNNFATAVRKMMGRYWTRPHLETLAIELSFLTYTIGMNKC